ncbi:MAG TPA: flagellar basal body rod protein FlgB [Bacillota bacterium]|nr:flagellar basal body rod protein FlgB [Bacillota bacterium]
MPVRQDDFNLRVDGVIPVWKNLTETQSSRILERAMDQAAYRSQLLAQNIANVNTPNYKRVDLDFAKIMQQASQGPDLEMKATHHQHFRGIGGMPIVPPTIKDNSTTMRVDGNNVDVEFEMAKVAENSMFYQALASSWKRGMSRLRMVIEGRA